MSPREMVKGSLYQMARYCGNPNCKCARGEKHISWYLSRQVEGQTKLTYVGRVVPAGIHEGARRYQNYQKLLAEIRKIDNEISKSLNQIRDVMIRTIEEMGKKK
jgi:hypothetical protein